MADDGKGFPFRGRYDAAELARSNADPVTLRERVTTLGGSMILDSSDRGAEDLHPPSAASGGGAMTIRIVLADDHPVVRRGLLQFFADVDDFDVVAECGDGESALDAVRKHAPDVLVVDLRIPGVCGMDVIRRLRGEAGAAAVILLAGDISDDDVSSRCASARRASC